MYIQINESVPLNNMGTAITSAVAKIRTQATSPMKNGNTEQQVWVWYFEDYDFGDSANWSTDKALDITDNQELGQVRNVYKFERTTQELESGITTQSLYDDVKAAMVADGFTEGNLVVTE